MATVQPPQRDDDDAKKYVQTRFKGGLQRLKNKLLHRAKGTKTASQEPATSAKTGKVAKLLSAFGFKKPKPLSNHNITTAPPTKNDVPSSNPIRDLDIRNLLTQNKELLIDALVRGDAQDLQAICEKIEPTIMVHIIEEKLDDQNRNLLDLACFYARAEVVDTLLKAAAKDNLLYEEFISQTRPLHELSKNFAANDQAKAQILNSFLDYVGEDFQKRADFFKDHSFLNGLKGEALRAAQEILKNPFISTNQSSKG